MEYEIVTLKEKIAVGVSARTNNTSPDMGAVIGGLWDSFSTRGSCVYPRQSGCKSAVIYTEYDGDETADYTVMVACETTKEPSVADGYSVLRIPPGGMQSS